MVGTALRRRRGEVGGTAGVWKDIAARQLTVHDTTLSATAATRYVALHSLV